jgi:diazepam-binding inhibitor (GABA receptor modulating acyl-CoA-binding protein)
MAWYYTEFSLSSLSSFLSHLPLYPPLSQKVVKNLPNTPTNDQLLKIYALYKCSTVGPKPNPEDEPSRFNIKAYAKYHAWLECGQGPSGTMLHANDAKAMYVKYVERLSGRSIGRGGFGVAKDSPWRRRSTARRGDREISSPETNSTEQEPSTQVVPFGNENNTGAGTTTGLKLSSRSAPQPLPSTPTNLGEELNGDDQTSSKTTTTTTTTTTYTTTIPTTNKS